MNRVAKWLLPLLILAAGAGALFYLKLTREVIEAAPPAEKTWIVETVPFTPAAWATQITAQGTVVAGMEAQIRPQVAGAIVDMNPDFREGAAITSQSQLAQIDPFDYETVMRDAEAALDQANKRLAQLQREQKGQQEQYDEASQSARLAADELARQRTLLTRGVVARARVDEATRALNTARQQRAALQAATDSLASQISQQEQAIARAEITLSRARNELEKTRITAPFDGFLYQTNAALGQQVGPTETLARLVRADAIEINFNLAEADYARLEASLGQIIGQPVTIIWSPGETEHRFAGTITRRAATVATETGAIELYARLSSPDLTIPLRPGAFVKVLIDEPELVSVMPLPVTALMDGNRLFAVQPDEDGTDRLQRVEHTQLRRRDGMVYISTNLPMGTPLVTSTFPQMAPGLKADSRDASHKDGHAQ